MAPPDMTRRTGSRETKMHHSHLRTYVKPARATTAMWGEADAGAPQRFADVVMALVPASLILATATALLVVLI